MKLVFAVIIALYFQISCSKSLQANNAAERSEITFDNYNSYQDIENYLNDLAENGPESVTVETIGKSFEGRNIRAVKISTGGISTNKPSILIDGGMQARQWVSISTVLYVLEELLKEDNPIASYFDWHLLPLLNPDGYEFSRSDYEHRFWVKNRVERDSLCLGIDLDRNFDFHWAEDGRGTPCESTFAGPTPFSEEETKALRDYVTKINDNLKMYLTMRSVGQYILYPWRYQPLEPENIDDLKEVANVIKEGIYSYNKTEYLVGNAAEVFYQTTGTAEDWVFNTTDVEYAFRIELPSDNRTDYWDVAPERIRSVVEETYEGIKAVAEHLIRKYLTRN